MLPEPRACYSALKEGKFSRVTAHGEGCVKGFSDAGSIPAGSTIFKSNYATMRGWALFLSFLLCGVEQVYATTER